MKSLKQSIQEGLFDNIGVGVTKTSIINWIDENMSTKGLKIDIVNGKFIANADSVQVISDGSSLTNGQFEWGIIKEEFNCLGCDLKTLEGAPKYCDWFDCMSCEKLTNLKGLENCETRVIKCTNCKNLISLEGCPQNIPDITIFCDSCPKLKNLKGAPKKCDSIICSDCDNLESFEGGPEQCFLLSSKNCLKLKNIKGFPKKCIDSFDCYGCRNLTNIDDISKNNIRFIDCSYCKKLESIPEDINCNVLSIIGCTKLSKLSIIDKKLNIKKIHQ